MTAVNYMEDQLYLPVQHMYCHTAPGDALRGSNQKESAVNVHTTFELRSKVNSRRKNRGEICDVGKLPHQFRTVKKWDREGKGDEGRRGS